MPGSAPSTLWRISNFLDLTGKGGLRANGRWHSKGHRIVYLAASPPGALIEHLAHLDVDEADLPRTYNLLRVAVPSELKIECLKVPEEREWKPNHNITRSVGDEWLKSGRSALAEVPSAILPYTFNYLLNPDGTDAARCEVAEVVEALHDIRLLSRIYQ